MSMGPAVFGAPVRRRTLPRILGFVALALLLVVPVAQARKKKTDHLPPHHLQWLHSVEKLITKDERTLFLELVKDYQRDAFIQQFWKARDPYPQTNRNEFRDTWETRQEAALEFFGGLDDARSQTLLINGEPTQRFVIDCIDVWPSEVWYYSAQEFHGGDVLLLFYKRWGQGKWQLWSSLDNVNDLSRAGSMSVGQIASSCGGNQGDALAAALSYAQRLGPMGMATLEAQLNRPQERPQTEWVASFQSYSTDLDEGTELFEGVLKVSYPGRYQSRTVVQGLVAASVVDLDVARLGEYASYNLMLNGEVLSGETLFDSFRIKYDFGEGEVRAALDAAETGFGVDSGAALPLIFERTLRAGSYNLIIKVEDVNSGKVFRTEQVIEVPQLDQSPVPPPIDPETARILEEANRAIRSGDTTVTIGALRGEWQTGLVRIDALTTGPVAKVTFLLDGESVLTKRRPPFNVEVDMGDVPRARTLRVEAYDDSGQEVASDEVLLNGGRHRFAIELIEPKRGVTYRGSLRAEAEVSIPEGGGVERVELYLNESLVATLYQPPYTQPIVLPDDEPIAYVRAVAYTPDGNATEDLVFVNAPDYVDELDIEYVELYTTVLDRGNRPVDDLTESDFGIQEDGVAQQIVRFEKVQDLPIHAGVMIDVSASMLPRIEAAQGAALRFFELAITPKDRAAVVTFNDHPNLTSAFTNDITTLASGLAGLKAERGTALYDALVYSLYYFNGVRGQRTILLLSDGKDESSRFPFEDALEYAQRAGVTIYAIGLDLSRGSLDARRKLSKLADETGGRSFFIEDVNELDEVYETIQRELRSRYLIAYQSTNVSGRKEFRSIEVALSRSGLEAKTLRGYYP